MFFCSRSLLRSTVTTTSRRTWRGCGVTWTKPTPATSSPTPVLKPPRSRPPTKTWRGDWPSSSETNGPGPRRSLSKRSIKPSIKRRHKSLGFSLKSDCLYLFLVTQRSLSDKLRHTAKYFTSCWCQGRSLYLFPNPQKSSLTPVFIINLWLPGRHLVSSVIDD